MPQDWSRLGSLDAWSEGLGKTFGVGSGDPSNYDRSQLRGQVQLGDIQGGQAGMFANQGEANYGQQTANLADQAKYLQTLQNGGNSVSAMQLQQGLQQNLASQQAMAASASPQNSSMAARNAAMNMGRAATGMQGQQAMAGLAERNQATNNLTNAYLQQRGQDANVALNSRQNAIGAYGQGIQGYGNAMQNPQKAPVGPGMIGGILGAAMSDKRLKTEIRDADDDAKSIIAGLKAYSFKYKDKKYGRGEQVGIMAQDLERVGLKHAVIDTPSGKMVHGAKAATASLALVAALGRRVERLEGGKK